MSYLHLSPGDWHKLQRNEYKIYLCMCVHSKGDQSWVFIGRTDAKAETPALWPPHAKSWLIGKDSDVGRDWGQEEKEMTEDEMAGLHHWLDGHEFEWTLGVGDGQGGPGCCSSWGHKESDMTEWLNWIELNYKLLSRLQKSRLKKNNSTPSTPRHLGKPKESSNFNFLII